MLRWLGVEKIYLLENTATPTTSFVREIEDFIEDGTVEYTSKGDIAYQIRWYHECMLAHHFKHNWYVKSPELTDSILGL